MKTRIKIGLAFLAALWLCGCVQSLSPFYTDGAKVAVPELNGKWSLLGDNGRPKGEKDWVFDGGEILTYSEKGGSGILDATYFKVGDQLFVDSMAHAPDEAVISEWWTWHTVPVHMLCKVERSGDRLTFKPLSLEWMRSAVTNHLVSLPVVRAEKDEPMLLNATPEQWMEFLKAYGTNEEVFAESGACRFTRSPERVRLQEPVPTEH